jgi:hypothetical protein
MSKNTKLFEIEDYNLFGTEIEVFLKKDGKEKTIFIHRPDFEQWLKDDSRLDWIMDSCDYAGEHVQQQYSIPIEDYFQESCIQEVKTDLYDFIIKKLDYRKLFIDALENRMDFMLKSLFTAIILLTSLTSFSQIHIDFGGGVANVIQSEKVQSVTVPVMKIAVGYEINKIVTEAILQPSISRITNTPSYIGLKAGYDIHGFVPQIGYLYNYRNADDVSMNRWEIGYALKYQFQVNDNGGIYIESMYTKSSIELTAGFQVKF